MPASKPSDTQIMPADDAAIGRAVAILREGRPVALPTETVYGLAADAARADAVAAIYRTKGRSDFNPLIVHVPDMDAARRLAFFDERAEKLGQAFWPGRRPWSCRLRAAPPFRLGVPAARPPTRLAAPRPR